MSIQRRKTKVVKIGNVCIGGRHPVAVQGMTKTPTADIQSTLRQISELQAAGAEIVRLAVEGPEDARALRSIKQSSPLPLVADIHFNWRLAIAAIESGVDKIRLNPGNIYRSREVSDIARAAKSARIPIRVGLNSGSVRSRAAGKSAQSKGLIALMAESALRYIRLLEKNAFYDIVVSLKASGIPDTLAAYRRMSRLCDYPFHLGLTATGPSSGGVVKSSIAIGALLLDGIGDTIRISLTDTPFEEIRVARDILEAVGARTFGPQIVSCPTCGRCGVDLVKIVNELSRKIAALPLKKKGPALRVAVMGCVVNGPGEAREADIGIAFGKGEGLIFKSGKPFKKVSAGASVEALLKEAQKIG
ncbi:MAG: flavodoxin-dependent (E)-4-hydroxy-3-methylbut-2-enyl-diphosphate synthase [Candidatus Omnitrophica bacterium]|nr:flavodoxin-dependent (E)-4-hydroxy-3-methylbut-2-enyl-diphosphate synthase [Candidatus Omnitrophota bacterium]